MRTAWFCMGDRPLILLLCVMGLAISTPAEAQVRPDTTLPTNSRVEREGRDRIRITAGTQLDSSLFHSFERFSVPRQGRVTFADIPNDVETILTRVTGSSISHIDGLLEVLNENGRVSAAALFLINPNGIEFGRDAELRLNGSFLATTAESAILEDGTLFSARRPDTPVLTVSTPIGLQFGTNPGTIVNRSLAQPNPNTFARGLQVANGEAIALLGGDIRIPGGLITARSGQITLGSVGEPGQVGLTQADSGWNVDYQDIETFQNIQLSDFALLDASSPAARFNLGGGTIQIRGDRLTVTGETFILSDTFGDQNGRPISIQVSDLTMDRYSLIRTLTTSAAQAGDIVIQSDRTQLNRGAQIVSLTAADGRSGDVILQAQERIDIQGGFRTNGGFDPSGIFSQVTGPEVTGDGGTIILTTPQLRIWDGAQVNTTTFGRGDAGDIQIQADWVEIVGSALNQDGSLFKDPEENLPIGSGVFTGTEENSFGEGGDLELNVQRLSLRDGSALQTGTLGAGDAGTLRVQAADWIEIIGRDLENRFPTSLFAASGGIPRVTPGAIPDATGRGGDIQLRTGELRVLDGGAIAVGSLNSDPTAARGAGNLQIQAQTVRLENEGFLLAETASGNGGNITLRAAELLLMRHLSQISTTAGTEDTGGDGGDIDINARFILSVLQENNDITANAFEGQGGNVNITTDSLLGILFQTEQTEQSDITASSQFGLDGEVVINTLNIDPTQDVVQLPDDILDASRLVRQNCSAGRRSSDDTPENEFFVTGRGGVPTLPADLQSTESILTPWVTVELSDTALSNLSDSTEEPLPILEAQSWNRTSEGTIALVAHGAPSSRSENELFRPLNCP